MRNTLIASILLLILSALPAFSQTIEWTADFLSYYGAIDENRNMYTIGQTVSGSDQDVTISKLSSDGTLAWSETWNGGFADRPQDMAIDLSGNVYVVVEVYEEEGNSHDKHIALLKYSTTGTLLWEWHSTVELRGPRVVISPNGNIWVIASAHNSNPESCFNRNHYIHDAYLGYTCLLDSNGRLLSERTYNGGSDNYSVQNLGIQRFDQNGNTYIGYRVETDNCFVSYYQCYIIDPCDIENIHFALTCNQTGGIVRHGEVDRDYLFNDYYVHPLGDYYYECSHKSSVYKITKLNADEERLWSVTPRGPWDGCVSLNDVDGSIIVYSIFRGGENGPYAFYLTCYNADGSERWNIDFGNERPHFDSNRQAGYDAAGNWYVLTSSKRLMCYDVSDGTKKWDIDIGTTGYIEVDSDGTVWVSGRDGALKVVPAKKLVIKDAAEEPMANIEFELIKVTNNIPTLSEDTLGTFTTDDRGEYTFEISEQGDFVFGSGTLAVGDSVKIAKSVHSEPAVKHPAVMPTMYSIHLDNAKFAESGTMTFDTLESSSQDIIMNHTELRYNLLICVEWEATEDYLESLQENFKAMSNTLYDVTDGQVRLDTVHIADANVNWRQADMIIYANNSVWPNAGRGVPGILSGANCVQQIGMPRMWWGNADNTRNACAAYNPLDLMAYSGDYRTKIHEFGHYALGFYDEYLFWHPDSSIYSENDALRYYPEALFNYGVMDGQYADDGVMATELSGVFRYEMEPCRNTEQFRRLSRSCWEHFELWVEAVPWGADNLTIAMLKPDLADPTERIVSNPAVFFPGPNDDGNNLDYDVGGMIQFRNQPAPQANGYSNKHITVHHSTGGDNAEVTLKNGSDAYIGRIKQGHTSASGQAWVLGVLDADYTIRAQKGTSQATVTEKFSASSFEPESTGWMYGLAESGGSGISRVGNRYSLSASADSIGIELLEVQGYYPLIYSAELLENNLRFSLTVAKAFSEDPTLEWSAPNGGASSYELTSTSDGYEVVLGDSLGSNGSFTLWAVDDSSKTFFAPSDYVVADISHDQSNIWLLGLDGGGEFKLDSANSSLSRATILTASYPVVRTGLYPDAVQAGETQCLSVYPDAPLTGSNQTVIRYNDADLELNSTSTGDESSLVVYRWADASSGWAPIGGTVDTVDNAIYAAISETGVYAAFTTDIVTEVGDGGHGEVLPYQFELTQNYPNPFNPATTIAYSVPSWSHVTIEVFNVIGQKVKTLVNESKSAGEYQVSWDGRSSSGRQVSTGVYLYRFQAGDYTESRKMLLLK